MSQPVIEPNFEGEEMKVPEGMAEVEATDEVPTKSIISTGAIALLTIALLAIFAGLGYWYYLVMNTPITDTSTIGTEFDMDDNSMPASTEAEMSNSDEIEAIEADIESTEMDNLDQELSAIDAEMEAAMGAQ